MLNIQIEKLLTTKLGQPTRKVKKVSAWPLSSNADVVLETNFSEVNNESIANLWLPASYENKCDELTVVHYPKGKGRHSNTYPSKGLEREKAAIKIQLTNLADADRLLSSIN